MRAIQVARFGGPEVLELVDLPEPSAGDGEVLVEVEAAEVLFLDTQLRAGWGQEYFRLDLPIVPGAGVAGVVRSVGSGVDPGLVGQRVIAGTGGVGAYNGGGYAEQCVVPASEVFPVPSGVASDAALAALHDGATALSQLDLAAVPPGARVLITAAAGSLGSWLIPLLSATGATVVAAARGAAKLARVRELGAHETVDYSVDGWTDGIDGVDVVFDGAGGEIGRAAYEIVRPGGRFLGYGAASGDFASVKATRADVTMVGIYQPDPVAWRDLPRRALQLLADRVLTPAIGQTFPLSAAAAAHAAIESRATIGKTLLVANDR